MQMFQTKDVHETTSSKIIISGMIVSDIPPTPLEYTIGTADVAEEVTKAY